MRQQDPSNTQLKGTPHATRM